jgi:hypothetical protein
MPPQRGVEARETVLGAEHQMDDDEAQHRGRSMEHGGFQPFTWFLRRFLDRWPRLIWGAPLALIAKSAVA